MTTDEYILLVYKNLKGEITAEEFQLLNTKTAADPLLAETRFEIEDSWDLAGEEALLVSSSDTNKLYEKLVGKNNETKVAAISNEKINDKKTKSAKVFKIKRILSSVAAMLVLALGAMFLFQNDTVTYDSPGVYTLADNSTVTLREGSTLTVYKFDNTKRDVALNGEGYFEVAKDASRPFTVAGRHVKIEVLGTSFLVKQSGEDTYIDLTEGKISTLDSRTLDTEILTTGMKAHHTSDGKIKLMTGFDNLASWRDGFYQYRDTNLGNVVEELSIIFDTKIVITNADLIDCSFSGNLSGDTLDDLLRPIANKYKLNILQQDSQWILSNGTCN